MKRTLRHCGGMMLLRLSSVLARLFGHAVHCAPDAEHDQHAGHGAAGHTVGCVDHRTVWLQLVQSG